MDVYVLPTCMFVHHLQSVHEEARRGWLDGLGLELQIVCEPLCECCESNLHPLAEQEAFNNGAITLAPKDTLETGVF